MSTKMLHPSTAAAASSLSVSGDEGITDNESNFESASYYLGRNLARDDMVEIDEALAAGTGEDDVNEIPVWVRGETRWIAGATEHTTAADLVEALLLDDRGLFDGTARANTAGSMDQPSTAVLQQFCITERWRQMEQILEPRTKVWKIWKAWGEAQCEVRLRLRKIDRNGPVPSTTTTAAPTGTTGTSQTRKLTSNSNHQSNSTNKILHPDDLGDVPPLSQQLLYDSGRESPTGSAIVRRRRHRASKSTAAWLTQAQTVHPKSSKTTIEKLMSLILEQGETIQHQLSKLRDREVQISQLEEQKHRIREQEHGKNYLLETYLNGLHEAEVEGDADKELTTINSDSGVNTEDTQSPNGGTSPTVLLENEEKIIPSISKGAKKTATLFEYTARENELLRDHENVKGLRIYGEETKEERRRAKEREERKKHRGGDYGNELEVDDERDLQEIEDKIEVLEKIYVINKHLQKEEELLVRLNAKIKRYESENPNLGEDELLDTLHRLNSEIEQRNREIEITNREIELSDELLDKKMAMCSELGAALGKTVDEEAALMTGSGQDTHVVAAADYEQKATQLQSCWRDMEMERRNGMIAGGGLDGNSVNRFDVNAESIYNISKILLKYSDEGAVESPEIDRSDRRIDERINIAPRGTINKMDTNKRIIANNGNRNRVTTRVQVHQQGENGGGGDGGLFDYATNQRGGNHYLPNSGCSTVDPVAVCAAAAGSVHPLITPDAATVTTLVSSSTPVDLIASGALVGHEQQRLGAGITATASKVSPINAQRNCSAALMDNKKLAHKNLILTATKAYEGLSQQPQTMVVMGGVTGGGQPPMGPQSRCPQTAADMTQLGTLV